MSTCRSCGSEEIVRARRRGLADRALALLDFWPYRCWHCELRFHARGRAPRPEPVAADASWNTGRTSGSAQAAAMAFRTHSRDPVAKVLISAESPEQLDKILLALEHAVSCCAHSSDKEQRPADFARAGNRSSR